MLGVNIITSITAVHIHRLLTEAVAQRCSVKKLFLEISQNSQENTCAQVFSCEFCENSKNTFSYRTPPVAASVAYSLVLMLISIMLNINSFYPAEVLKLHYLQEHLKKN